MKMRIAIVLERPSMAPLIELDEVADGFFGELGGEDIAVHEYGEWRVGTVGGGFAVVDFGSLRCWWWRWGHGW